MIKISYLLPLMARLAQDFGIPEDSVRGWHCLVLLRRGHDVLGEEAMAQVCGVCLCVSVCALQHRSYDLMVVCASLESAVLQEP